MDDSVDGGGVPLNTSSVLISTYIYPSMSEVLSRFGVSQLTAR